MTDPKQTIDRRAALAGAGAVGALAAAAVALPGTSGTPEPKAADAAAPVQRAEGYRLTEHIKRYYASARI